MFSQVGRDIETIVTLWTIPILPIPPAPPLLNEFLIEIQSIGQDHIVNRALVLVLAVGL